MRKFLVFGLLLFITLCFCHSESPRGLGGAKNLLGSFTHPDGVGRVQDDGVTRVYAEGAILPEAARIGVGVGLGKMQLGEVLSPGGVYKLPKLPVINTGLVSGTFKVRADLVTGPVIVNKESVSGWVRFSPAQFDLDEGQSRLVKTELTLPFDAPPGDYLVYLEASMIRNSGMAVSLSPAAATKLYFSIQPSSVLGAYRARFLTFIETNPVIYLVLALLLVTEAGFILRRHWRFRVEVRK